MKIVFLKCPKCKSRFEFKNYFSLILHSPFHWFGKRYTKCPNCQNRSWMGRGCDSRAKRLAKERDIDVVAR